jgi:PAS domain S-box-containing protein
MTAGGAQALMAFLAGGDAGRNKAFREIVETLPVAIYATDAEGRLTYFNDAAKKLSGRTPELGTDKWCVTWKLFLPDGTPQPHDQCPMALALKGLSLPNGIECVAERPDGTRFWFAPYPAVLRDGEGRIVGGVNVLVDITDRKNAEIEAREQLRTIIEATPECVKIVARDGTLLFMNAPGLEMVGAASAEAIAGMKVCDLIAPEDRERFREFNERICRGEKGSMEFNMVSLQGVRRNMESHAAPLQYVDGSTVQLAIAHDISERKQAERAGLRLSAIVDSSDDAIISKDLNGIITSWNKSAERLFGYTAAEAVGQPITMLIPSDRLGEEPNILSRLRRGERVDHFETVRRRKDGMLLDISLTISPVRDERGTIVGASKIARDISERKLAEQERRDLEESERALAIAAALRETEAELARVSRALTVGELATSIAHEVNQPLAAIVTNGEAGLRWLNGKAPKVQEAQESLELIVRDANRASAVIRRIREFLKKDSQQVELDIRDVVQEAAALVRDDLLKKQIALRLELADDLPPVRGDRIQLQQVILNLIMNGSDAIAELTDGLCELIVIAQRSGTDQVLVAVRDCGAGADPQNVTRMFDPFFTTKQSGIGMGLSISRSIIEAHGGHIWAEPNDGPGLTVQFTLPLERETP